MTLVKFNHPTRRPAVPTISNLFQDLLDSDYSFRQFPERANQPSVNISESAHKFHLELSVPGFGKEAIDIAIDENTLTIKGENEEKKEASDKKFSRKEFSYQSFKRSFTLPENVDQEKIEAKFENGILHIDLPKKADEQKQSRKIELQ
ncbi:MAG: Hsp20/alpha crystallin family protein [Bacteroidia bacterium]